MPGNAGESAFNRWQEAQRQLHALEREIQEKAREHRSGKGPYASEDLVARAHDLRLEVDVLFPAAMNELEDQVRRIKSRRPRLGDL